jgi:O-antigen/teichoic acid export membrane protein
MSRTRPAREGLRKTLSHSAIYGVGMGAQNLVGLVMLPIYTRLLTPADYGTLGMMQIVIDLAALVFGAQLSQGVFRNYYAAEDEGQRNAVVASALGFVIAAKLVGVAVLVMLSDVSAQVLFGSRDLAGYMALFAVSLLTSSLFLIPFQYLRALERPVAFVILSLLKLVIQVGLNLHFLVNLRMGILGVIWSTVLTGLTLGLGMAVWTLFRTRFAFSLSQARSLLSFSWPLILAGFIELYVSAGARYVISAMSGLGEVGLFMLAHRLAGLMRSSIWRPFQQVWMPQRFKLVGTEHGVETYQRGFLLMSVVLVCAGLGLAMFSPDLIRVMSNKSFAGAASIVPLLVMQNVIVVASRFSRFGLLVEGRTKAFLGPTLASALVATAVALVLAPRFGAIGVAVALVCQATFMLWLIERMDRSTFDVRLPWGRFWALVCIGAIAYAVSLLAIPGSWGAFGFKLVLYVTALSGIYVSPIVGARERDALRRLAIDIGARLRRGPRSRRRVD